MKAVYNISYGVYILSAKGEKHNGCIINTLVQVTSSPVRISVTVNKDNYTTGLILKSGEFNVSILDMTTEFEIIKRFGFSSGKDTDKFKGFLDYKISSNGIAYITKNTNAFLSAKVVSSVDNGTHITFFADVVEDAVLSNEKPITYAYYLENLKPKPKASGKIVYVCRVCGYVYEGDALPDDFVCPICKHGAKDFDRIEQGDVMQKQIQEKPTADKKKYVCPICGYEVEADEKPDKCIICGAEMIEKV